MTKDEAIKGLKYLAKAFDGYKPNEEMFRMAIEALEHNVHDFQKDADCISRQAAIDAVRHAWAKGLEPSQYIEDLPSVHPAYTDAEIQKMQDMEQAEIEKAFDLGREDARSEIIRCKDCKYFEYDHPYVVFDVPVIGHLVCNKWGGGCRTDENGFCFMGERRTDEQT